MKKVGTLFLILCSLMLGGCAQNKGEEDLRSVPVTNNPRIVPEGSSLPGMSNLPH